MMLGIDAQLRAEWMHTLDNLEPFATAVDNTTGRTVLVFADETDGGIKPGPAVTPVFPSGIIGIDSSPELLAMARDTAERRS